MITNFKLNVDYTKDIIGVTAEKTMRYKFKKEKKLKVNIPSLMSKITKAKPKTENISIYGKNIFVNDPSCKPYLSTNVIKSRNYITIELNDLLNIDKYIETDKDGNKYFPKDKKLVIKTPDGDYRNFKCNVR